MDRAGALPDRCVICNRPAQGYRVAQTLYWSPPAWKVGAWSTPFVVMGAGLAVEAWWILVLFWPTAILLVLANFFVRKSLRLRLGLCPRHRRIRTVLGALSIACIAAVIAAVWNIGRADYSGHLLLGSLGGLLVLMVIQSLTGLRRLGLKHLSGEHAWLARTGEPFRASLPEMTA